MTYIKLTLKVFLYTALLWTFGFAAAPGYAQSSANPVIIRDAEIEETLKMWLEPLLKAASMSEDSVKIVIVQSSQVNAFVAGGANIFIYTGLIDKTESPDELIGVMAHELGHISGGHLISTRDAMERASYESILGMVVGVGAAIASGDGSAASAIIAGSSDIAGRRFMAHSRLNESSADQAALKFFETAEMNSGGLSSFLGKLESDELLPVEQQREYVRTHPLTHNRIEALQTRINTSPYKDKKMPESWVQQHLRMKAKLLGFIDPGRVPWSYDDRDQSIPARYARSIASYRQNHVQEALAGIDALIEEEPENAYFQELKGQMLKDFGRVAEALPYYKKAVDLKPDAGLIRIDYAHALLESGGKEKNIDEAVVNLNRALQDEPRSEKAHRLLATAYGEAGQENLAKLQLAEEAVLQRRLDYAEKLTESALASFEENSREWVQAKDLLAHIQNLKDAEG